MGLLAVLDDIAMDWSTIGSAGDGVGGVAGAAAAIAAAVAIITTRKDQYRRDASGLHGEMYFQAQELPGDVALPDEPGVWSDSELVCKVTNSSGHPYYRVVASVYLQSRRQRYAARADVIGPATTLYASLGLVIGCDLAAMNDDVQVVVTFVDSQGRAWRRDETGRLKRLARWRVWLTARRNVRAYPGRAAALHGIRAVEIKDEEPDALTTMQLVDARKQPTEIAVLGPGADQIDADKMAMPPRTIARGTLVIALEQQGWPQASPRQAKRWTTWLRRH